MSNLVGIWKEIVKNLAGMSLAENCGNQQRIVSEVGRVVVEICPESGRIVFSVKPWYESGQNLVRIWNEYVRNLAGAGVQAPAHFSRSRHTWKM